MENEIFPWNPLSSQRSQEKAKCESEVAAPSWSRRQLVLAKPILPYLGIGVVLIVFFFLSQKPGEQQHPSYQAITIEVLTPIFPIQKGEEVPMEALRIVPVRKNLYSKTQLLGLMNTDNLQSLKGRLLAKKPLFPNKALFWSDLDLKKAPQKQRAIQIIYSN